MPRMVLDHFTCAAQAQSARRVRGAGARTRAGHGPLAAYGDHPRHGGGIGADKEKQLAAMFGMVTLAVSSARTHVTYHAMPETANRRSIFGDHRNSCRLTISSAPSWRRMPSRCIAVHWPTGEGTYLPRDKEQRVKAA